jgi:hypothetical protein
VSALSEVKGFPAKLGQTMEVEAALAWSGAAVASLRAERAAVTAVSAAREGDCPTDQS